MSIVLFDPSLSDNNGKPSANLGDLIIFEFVNKVLEELFPNQEIKRIATHSAPSPKIKKSIGKGDLCFLGGTNIFNSTVNIYNNWHWDKSIIETIFSKRLEVISLGVGWGEYQNKPNTYSALFYKRRLSHNYLHSLRDAYSLNQLQTIKGLKGLNTCCPTTWWLDGRDINRQSSASINTCLFTLTDYAQDKLNDSFLIEALLNNFEELLFFPQGKNDMAYLNSLNIYLNNRGKIKIIEPSLTGFKNCLNSGNLIYIGTRLHAGILAMNYNIDTLIISIDNRAKEMAKDVFLPVIERNNLQMMSKWLAGEAVFKETTIQLPKENIQFWKKQFVK